MLLGGNISGANWRSSFGGLARTYCAERFVEGRISLSAASMASSRSLVVVLGWVFFRAPDLTTALGSFERSQIPFPDRRPMAFLFRVRNQSRRAALE